MAGVTVDFNANLARFTTEVNRANARLDSFGDTAQRISGGISTAFAAMGVGISVAGIVGVIKSTIDAADNLNDLSIKTGIAVEKLSGLQLVANQSGTDLEATALAVNRLSKNLGENSGELAKIGITAKDPLQAFAQLADVFKSIEDPQLRAALGAKVMGKSWQGVAPLLSLGGDELLRIVEKGEKASGITQKLAANADEFNDNMAELDITLQGFKNNAVGPLIGVLNDLNDAFKDDDDDKKKTAKDVDELAGSYKAIGLIMAGLAADAETAGAGVVALAKKMDGLIHLDFSKFDAIDAAFSESQKKAVGHFNEFVDKIEGIAEAKEIEIPVTAKTTVNGDGSTGVAKDVKNNIRELVGATEEEQEKLAEFNKVLESELKKHLKGIENNIDEESSLYQYRNKQVEVALDLSLISQEDYYAKKQALQKDQLAETEALLDQEINALKQFQSEATNEAQRTDAQDKINDLIREKTKLERDGQIATLENAAAAQQALGQYGSTLVDINQLLAGVASNIIGISQAQAELNFKSPGDQVTQQDLVNPNTIFQNAAGNSFSDQPIEEPDEVRKKIQEIKQEAAASGSGILLDVQVDKGSAVANLDETVSLLQEKLKNVELPVGVLMNKAGNFFTDNPLLLKTDVDQQEVINSIIKARDGAQAAVTPVIVPVIFQAQNSPNAPAAAGNNSNFDLAQTALASGGR